MAIRALNSVVAANYNKLSTDPILAGDIVAFNTNDVTQNPSVVRRAVRNTQLMRAAVLGVAADDALGTNPYGETPTMINNDPAGSNFVNGSAFQSYTAGFYVGVKRAISEFKDESVDVITNLTAGIPTYASRGVSVYTTPSSQFITDRFTLLTISSATADGGAAWTPTPGDLVTWGGTNSAAVTTTPTNPQAATASTYNAGLLVKWAPNTGSTATEWGQPIGRVDYYDSGAGLLYWTLF
jgi:hypothetical protein